MEIRETVARLAALAQETRLRVFRLLVEAGEAGLNAGAIAAALDVPASTLSFHIAHLARAGLVNARQESRFVFYTANFPVMDAMLAFLTDDCCQGAGQCLPRTAALSITAGQRRKAA